MEKTLKKTKKTHIGTTPQSPCLKPLLRYMEIFATPSFMAKCSVHDRVLVYKV